MGTHIERLDTIALTAEIPSLGLTAGEVGVVVDVFGDGEAFEVEFCDNSGSTSGLHTLRPNQLLSLHSRGQTLRMQVEAA